VKWYLRKSGC